MSLYVATIAYVDRELDRAGLLQVVINVPPDTDPDDLVDALLRDHVWMARHLFDTELARLDHESLMHDGVDAACIRVVAVDELLRQTPLPVWSAVPAANEVLAEIDRALGRA